jgi:hypothetical protein
MRTFLLVACLWTTSAYIVNTTNFTTSVAAGNWTTKLRVVFWNFDKTIPVGSVGGTYLQTCGGPITFNDTCGPTPANNCTTYNLTVVPGGVGNCPCTADNTAFANFYTANNVSEILDSLNFNGSDRLARFNQTLKLLADNGVINMVASTAWYYLTSTMWTNFLNAYFTAANINMYLNTSQILAFADPGCNIGADKGSAIASYLSAHGWSEHDGILVDGSSGNIASATGKVDWLKPIPKAGIQLDGLQYIEARALYNPVAPTSAPTSAPSAAAGIVPAISALIAWLLV